MKKLIFLSVLIAVFSLISCDKIEEYNTSLVGVWTNPQYNDSIITYDRIVSLKENDYGLEVKSDGTIVERKNAGWCGTPPISYGDFAGTWNENDLSVNIQVDFWGGTEKRIWKVLSIDSKKLTVKQMKSEYTYK